MLHRRGRKREGEFPGKAAGDVTQAEGGGGGARPQKGLTVRGGDGRVPSAAAIQSKGGPGSGIGFGLKRENGLDVNAVRG